MASLSGPARSRDWIGPVLAAFAAGLFGWLLTLAPRIADGEALRASREWIPAIGLDLAFRLDGLSYIFALLVTGTGSLVFLYSAGYMAGHPRRPTYHLCLSGFLLAMLGLVLADNILCLYVFWELTTLTSFFLIGFEHEKAKARRAAWQALMVTTAGGLAMLIGLLWLGHVAGAGEISEIRANGEVVRGASEYGWILGLILFAAFTKSAQFPFHFWLPNSMAAPTPVSAYLHSATMVKAGVYLLARLSPALGGTDAWSASLGAVGGVTMVAGAWIALGATDLKRALAYLTLSALGFLVLLLGMGGAEATRACMAFLVAHALYKGSLFMVVGSVDHAAGTRDLGKLGGLGRAMPMTAAAAFAGALGLAALGPVLSFAGKEEALGALLTEGRWGAAAAVSVAAACFVAAALTISIRVFMGRKIPDDAREGSFLLWGPALALGAACCVAAAFTGHLNATLFAPATAVVAGHAPETAVKLWHGLNRELMLSLGSAAAGVVLFVLARGVGAASRRVGRVVGWISEGVYEAGWRGLFRAARRLTAALHHGRLRWHLLTLAGTAAAFALAALATRGFPEWRGSGGEARFHEVALGVIMLAAIVAACRFKTRLGVIASLSVVGFGTALFFALFSAPDVAMTQFLAETLMLVVLVVAFHHLPTFRTFSSRAARIRDAGIGAVAGGLMAVLAYAAAGARPEKEASRLMLSQSVEEAKGHNVVNVMLVDFRALDTMGETTVLVTAAVGVFALLRGGRRREAWDRLS